MTSPDDGSICNDHLPLRPQVFAMLATLAPGPRHGYDVMQRVNENLGRRALLGPGTLYRVLKELRDLGWIEEVDAPEPEVDQRRRYYSLTALGWSVVDAEASRLRSLVRVLDEHREDAARPEYPAELPTGAEGLS